MKKYSWLVRHTAKPITRFIQFHKKYNDDFTMIKNIELIIIMVSVLVVLGQLNSTLPVVPVKSFIVMNIIGWGLAAFIAIIQKIITLSIWVYHTYLKNIHGYLKQQNN